MGKYDMKQNGKYIDPNKTDFGTKVIIGLFLAAVVALVLGYGHCMYGDWKCGMPGVECRKVSK